MKNSDCLKTTIKILIATGIWLPDCFASYPKRLFYNSFAITFQSLLFIIVVIAEIMHLVLVLNNTEETVNAAVLLLSHIVQAIKVFTIWFKNGEIKQLIRMINDPTFTKLKDTKQRTLAQKKLQTTKKIGDGIFVSVILTALFWAFVPFMDKNGSLPLNVAFPFDVNQSPVYELMYFYCSVSVIVVGLCDGAANFLVTGLIILPVIQLDVLCLQLLSIDRHGENKNIIYENVLTCIKHHQWIIRYVTELTKIFGLSIFCQFIASSIIVCMTVFKITITREPMEVVTVVFYLILVFMELLLYCYPGDLLINKSLEVSRTVYAGNWIYYETKTKKALLLLMMRAQRELVVDAKGVFKVSLATAASVIHTSYSYYAVLKNKNIQ